MHGSLSLRYAAFSGRSRIMAGLWILFGMVMAATPALATDFAGGIVGNGGDLVDCRPEAGSKFAGKYVLDYLAGYNPAEALIDTDPNPLSTIRAKLYEFHRSREFEGLAMRLDGFVERLQSQRTGVPNYLSEYVWIPQPYGLVDLEDEQLSQRIPANCYSRDGNRVALVQAVIRETRGSVLFRYDSRELMALRRASPLQFSFLLIHEWLRDTYQDATVIRDLNRLLHSRAFHSANLSQAKRMVLSLTNMESFHPQARRRQFWETVEGDFKRPEDVQPLVMRVPERTEGFVHLKALCAESECRVFQRYRDNRTLDPVEPRNSVDFRKVYSLYEGIELWVEVAGQKVLLARPVPFDVDYNAWD